MLAKPIRFRLLVSELSASSLPLFVLRRCRTVLVNYMLGHHNLKNVQDLTYFVYFFSKT